MMASADVGTFLGGMSRSIRAARFIRGAQVAQDLMGDDCVAVTCKVSKEDARVYNNPVFNRFRFFLVL